MQTEIRVIPFGKPLIGEEEKNAVLEVLNGPILVHGPRAKEFETNFSAFTGAKHSVSVSSCTAGLHLCYFYLGIGHGDEVIVPAQTHVATAHAVELCGAKPVFVDAENETGNINIDQIEKFITNQTRAISVVHFLGMPVNMVRVAEIAKKHRLFVIEDCALAIGSFLNGVHVGLYGDAGCFSFYPVKHMTTSEGGMVITQDQNWAEKLSKQKAFGVDRHMGERSVPGIYDVTMLGFNYRMSEIEAAIGIEQLKRMPKFLERRKENYERLSEKLKEISEVTQLTSTHGEYQSSYYCLPVLLKDSLVQKRFEIVEYLKKAGVGTSIYYPKPVPFMKYYQEKYGAQEKDFPVASWISNATISLPVGPHLDGEDMFYMAKTLKEAIQQVQNK